MSSILPEVPGRDTQDATLAGELIGKRGAVRGLVPHLADAKYFGSLALHGLALLLRRSAENDLPPEARLLREAGLLSGYDTICRSPMQPGR